MLNRASKKNNDGRRQMRNAWRESAPGLVSFFIFSIFVNFSKLAIPLFIFQLLDRVLSSKSLETLFMLSIMAFVAIVVGVFLDVIRRSMLTQWGVWIERRFGRQLFLNALEKQGEKNRVRPTRYLRDLATLRSFVSSGAIIAGADVVWTPVFISIAYLVHPAFAALACLAIILALVLGWLNEITTRQARKNASIASMDSQDWLISVERNAKTVASLNMVKNLVERWYRESSRRHEENKRTRSNTLMIRGCMKLIAHALHILTFAIGVWLVIEGSMSVGGVIAANVLNRIAFSAVRRAMSRWRNITSAWSAYNRIKNRLTQRPGISFAENSGPLDLVLDDVTHRYPGQSESVFRHVALRLEPGTILCVTGPSGSGKSTFVDLMTGVAEPRNGAVRFGDIAICRYAPHELAGKMGYLRQNIRHFRGTIGENIARMGTVNQRDVVDAARLAGIHETIVGLPLGYDTLIDEDETVLSGGQLKAVALARAYYGKPKLLVLDEPAAHLDGSGKRALRNALQYFKESNAIVVMTSQRRVLTTNLVKITDKWIILDHSSKVKIVENPGEAESPGKNIRRLKTASSYINL